VKVIQDSRQPKSPNHSSAGPLLKSVVTIGNFDGVHIGHRELLRQLLQKSRSVDAPSVVLTFDPHPIQVLYPEKHHASLFDRDDQVTEFEKMGVDYLFIQPFSRELSQMSPETFLNDIIIKPLSPKALIVGHDFSFGANRSGSFELLKKYSQDWNFDLTYVPPFQREGQTVSSSLVREKVKNGEMESANQLLGREFYLKGIVIKGAQRGRTIGFPTVNIAPHVGVVPHSGVYATQILIEGKTLPSVTNIGFNPTFQDDRKIQEINVKIETHILNFKNDLYGQKISILFHKRLREEKKFASIDQLKSQISKDVESAREFFKLN